MDFPIQTSLTTKGGIPAIIYAYYPKQEYPYIGAVFVDGVWKPYSWTKNGEWASGFSNLSQYNLTPVKPKLIKIEKLRLWKDALMNTYHWAARSSGTPVLHANGKQVELGDEITELYVEE